MYYNDALMLREGLICVKVTENLKFLIQSSKGYPYSVTYHYGYIFFIHFYSLAYKWRILKS